MSVSGPDRRDSFSVQRGEEPDEAQKAERSATKRAHAALTTELREAHSAARTEIDASKPQPKSFLGKFAEKFKPSSKKEPLSDLSAQEKEKMKAFILEARGKYSALGQETALSQELEKGIQGLWGDESTKPQRAAERMVEAYENSLKATALTKEWGPKLDDINKLLAKGDEKSLKKAGEKLWRFLAETGMSGGGIDNFYGEHMTKTTDITSQDLRTLQRATLAFMGDKSRAATVEETQAALSKFPGVKQLSGPVSRREASPMQKAPEEATETAPTLSPSERAHHAMERLGREHAKIDPKKGMSVAVKGELYKFLVTTAIGFDQALGQELRARRDELMEKEGLNENDATRKAANEIITRYEKSLPFAPTFRTAYEHLEKGNVAKAQSVLAKFLKKIAGNTDDETSNDRLKEFFTGTISERELIDLCTFALGDVEEEEEEGGGVPQETVNDIKNILQKFTGIQR